MKRTFSFRFYLILSHSLLLAISLGAIAFIWSRNEYTTIAGELQSLMRERAILLSGVLSHEISEYHTIKVSHTEFPQFALEENLLAVFIDDSNLLYDLKPGSVNSVQIDLFLRLSQQHPLYKDAYASIITGSESANSVYAAAPVFDSNGKIIGKVCLLMPLGELDSYIKRLRLLLIGATIFITLLSIGVSLLLTNYFSHHFSNAQKLAATVAEGNYHLRIPETGPTELRDLSHYLNQLAEKLQEQFKTRRMVLANMSHELARPLAGLQIGIESLRKGAMQDPNLADDLLVSMSQTIQRMEGLVDDITLAAHPQTQPLRLDREPVAIEPFLKGVATRFGILAKSRGIKFKVQIEPGLTSVLADERRLTQIIGNLVDNAIKFTPRGRTIRLVAETAGDRVRLIVHDGGNGISAEEAEHIFEPFFQGDLGRRVKQGMGLGLAIAQQLAQAHGGELTLENHPKRGMLAILSLPAKSA